MATMTLEHAMRRTAVLGEPWNLAAGTAGGLPWHIATAPDALDARLARLRDGDEAGPLAPAVAGAFLAGWLAAALVGPGVAMITTTGHAPVIDPRTLHVRMAPGGWVDAIGLRPAVLAGDADPQRAAAALAAGVHACLAPVLERIAATTPLGLGMLWALVADTAHLGRAEALAAGAPIELVDRLWASADTLVDDLSALVPGGIRRRPRLVPAVPPGSPACAVRATCCLAHRTPRSRLLREAGVETRCAPCPLRA